MSPSQTDKRRQVSREWYYSHKENRTYKVYLLRDHQGVPFYVGYCCSSLAQRKAGHVYGAKNRVQPDCHVEKILDSLSKGSISIEMIEEVPDKETAKIVERQFIGFFSNLYKMTNERCLPKNKEN